MLIKDICQSLSKRLSMRISLYNDEPRRTDDNINNNSNNEVIYLFGVFIIAKLCNLVQLCKECQILYKK